MYGDNGVVGREGRGGMCGDHVTRPVCLWALLFCFLSLFVCVFITCIYNIAPSSVSLLLRYLFLYPLLSS
jgi:hypothetical protein